MNIQTGNAMLKDRRILIVGGTSGIGLEVAVQSQRAGADVIVVGSGRARAESVAMHHGFHGWRVADVTAPDTITAALSDTGHIDHLVLLAGSFIVGGVMTADIDQLRRVFDERMWAAIHVLRSLGDRLASDASVTLASGAIAERPSAHGTAVIAAASSAMEALARGLALELAPRRVNAIAPGPTDTPLLHKALGPARDTYLTGLADSLPLKRIGTVDDVASAIMFLMANSWMTGETLHVDGGSRLI